MGKHRDWTEIRDDYQLNGLSYAKLAEKYGVSIDTLKKAAARQGWTNRKQKADKLSEIKTRRAGKAICAAEKKAPVENGTIETAPAENGTEVSTEDRFQRAVSMLIEKAEIAIDRLPPEETKAIKELSGALKDLAALKGWNKDDLDRQEQKARIEKLRVDAANAKTDDGRKISVNIMGMDVDELAEVLQ